MMRLPSEPILIDDDLVEWIEEHIEVERDMLERQSLNSHDTEYHRGRVSALRAILKLREPPRPYIIDGAEA